MLGVTLNVMETTATFHKKVVEAICEEVNSKLSSICLAIRNGVANDLKPIFINTDDYRLMTSDPKILGDMGLPASKKHDIFDAILQRICDSVEVTFQKFHTTGTDIKGGFNVGIVIADYSDILPMKEAYIISKNGVNEWLGWLLLRGSDIVVNNYHVEYVMGRGRSSLAFMDAGGDYSVDSRVSGTKNDNWLTRALSQNEKELKQLILSVAEEEFERVL